MTIGFKGSSNPALFGCITSAGYVMKADVLEQFFYDPIDDDEYPEEPSQLPYYRDPYTNEIIRDWRPVPDGDEETPARPGRQKEIRCIAAPIITGGINVQGSAERWTSKGEYEVADYVVIKYSPMVTLTRRDQITNIRDSSGKSLWVEEEYFQDGEAKFKNTIFNIGGISPILDAFGNHIENYALLSRAEVQNG